MNVILGSDPKGVGLKLAVKAYLKERGYAVSDVYPEEGDAEPHTLCAQRAARALQDGTADRAVLICGTGMGMAITANKFKGVYAAVVESTYAAEYARKINDANALCMGAFIVGETMACEIAEKFLSTGFTEGFPPARTEFVTSQRALLRAVEEEQFS